MDSTDLLGSLASGDTKHTVEEPPHPESTLKREQDSTDDFEHLDRESKRDETNESPLHHHGAARAATKDFLDMEREEMFVDSPRAPSPRAEKLIDHIADKFTDSESDADTAGESPLHRPLPAEPPSAPTMHEPSSVLLPTTTVPPPVPKHATEPNPEKKPEPIEKPAPAPAPAAAPNRELPPPPKTEEPVPHREETAPPAKAAAQEAVAEQPRSPTAHVIEAEVIFCQMGLDAWFDPQRLHPKVESLIYWRCAARSGAALGAGLVLLVALACCSVVSVLAYASLLALTAAVAFRVYKNVLQAVQKTNEGHPFKWLLEKDMSVPADRAQALAAAATAHLNAATHELRRLFLVEDLVDSLKFGVLLWCLTYVGACFNGITLIILGDYSRLLTQATPQVLQTLINKGWIALFTLPKAYEMNKAQVDSNLELARAKINEISAKVRAAVPLGRKGETPKDK